MSWELRLYLGHASLILPDDSFNACKGAWEGLFCDQVTSVAQNIPHNNENERERELSNQ